MARSVEERGGADDVEAVALEPGERRLHLTPARPPERRAAADAARVAAVVGARGTAVQLRCRLRLDDVLEARAPAECARVVLLHPPLLRTPPAVLERRRHVRCRLALDELRQHAHLHHTSRRATGRARRAVVALLDPKIVGLAGWEATRLEARALARQTVAQLVELAVRLPAALALVDQQHHDAALARRHPPVAAERLRVARLPETAQLLGARSTRLRQLEHEPRDARLLTLLLLNEQHRLKTRHLLEGAAAAPLELVARRAHVRRKRREPLLAQRRRPLEKLRLWAELCLCACRSLGVLEERHQHCGCSGAVLAARRWCVVGPALLDQLQLRVGLRPDARHVGADGVATRQRLTGERYLGNRRARVVPLLLLIATRG